MDEIKCRFCCVAIATSDNNRQDVWDNLFRKIPGREMTKPTSVVRIQNKDHIIYVVNICKELIQRHLQFEIFTIVFTE